MEIDHARTVALVEDAAYLIDKEEDFSSYDGIMMVVGADFKRLGRHGYVLRFRGGFPELYTPGGQLIPPADVHTFNCPFPSITHSLAHILGGYEGSEEKRAVVPDMWDFRAQSTLGSFGYANQLLRTKSGHQYSSLYVGPWDIMSQHGIKINPSAPLFEGLKSQGMTSFTKLKLGWIRPKQITILDKKEVLRVILAPLWKGDAETLVIRIPLDENRYYLIENRQLKGVDSYLPSAGVLILNVDESIPDGQGPVKVINAHPKTHFFRKATFKMGEKYNDHNNKIFVKILTKKDDNYLLEIVRE
jgi:hypothetical protein